MSTEENGEKCQKHHVVVYTLSTCGWCKKMKRLLDALEVEYENIDVDRLKGDKKKEAMETVMKHNPKGSFPTMIIDDKKVIIGFQEEEVKGVLLK